MKAVGWKAGGLLNCLSRLTLLLSKLVLQKEIPHISVVMFKIHDQLIVSTLQKKKQVERGANYVGKSFTFAFNSDGVFKWFVSFSNILCCLLCESRSLAVRHLQSVKHICRKREMLSLLMSYMGISNQYINEISNFHVRSVNGSKLTGCF